MKKDVCIEFIRKKKFCSFCSSKIYKIIIERKIRLFCINCQTILYENPIPAVCTVLVNKLNKLLLVKRSVEPQKGEWCLPGGFMEIGETPEQTAKRELNEETGLTGEIDSLIGVSSNNDAPFHSIIVMGYLVKLFYGSIIPGDDATEACFFDKNILPKIAFKSHISFISNYFNK